MSREIQRAHQKWREQWNPLRSLTLQRALDLLDQAQRGEHAEVQWAFRLMERRFPPLTALIERRIGALLEMEWEVEQADPEAAGYDKALAEAQHAFLRGYYEQVGNLYEAVEHLALAQFRGFGICEIVPSPAGTTLAPVDGWNVVQDGLRPRFRYNPLAGATTYDALGQAADLPLERLVVHTTARPIHELALVLFVRAALSEKDWDAWCDIYGIPGGVVTGPPQVPTDKEGEYRTAAEDIAQGGSGYLPHGSAYTANGHPSGTAPYADRLKWITEQLVLAGTGGQLTMLAQPTGIGGGASSQHGEAFRAIARGDARRLTETFQRQVDRPLLSRVFPGQPVLAYWKLCLNDEVDTGAVVDQAAKLAQAGYKIRLDQLSERTGYDLEAAPPSPPPTGTPGVPVLPPSTPPASGAPDLAPTPPSTEPAANRLSGASGALGAITTLAGSDTPPRKPAESTSAPATGLVADLAPLRGRMAVVLRQLADPESELEATITEGLRILDAAGPDVLRGDNLARELEAALQQAVIQGAGSRTKP